MTNHKPNLHKIKRNILLNPGPSTTSDSVKRSLVVPDICPREKEFGDLMESISLDLVKIVHGEKDYVCTLFGGSGTAAMEAVVSSVVRDDVLIISNGAYGKRMEQICNIYSIKNTIFESDGISPIDIKKLEFAIALTKPKYLIAIHHETTTGMLNPIYEIGLLAKHFGCVFIVDAVSSFAGIPINIKDNHIDHLISTSNKCIQGMPGICFVISRKNQLLDKPKPRTLYLDLHSQYQYFEKYKQMRFTPPVQIIYALRQAIEEYFLEGEQCRYDRYKANWEVLTKGMKRLGFRMVVDVRFQSKLLTTFFEKEGISFNEMHDYLYTRGFTIYPGKLDDRPTFRIANMGDIDYRDINNFLKTLGDFLCQKKN